MVVPVAVLPGRPSATALWFVAGNMSCAVGGLWFYLRMGTEADYLDSWLPGLLFAGTAICTVLPALSGAPVAKMSPARFGIGSAVDQAIRQIGGVLANL